MPILDIRLLSKKMRKDNTMDVKLSIAHNGKTRYISTGVSISSVTQFKNGLIVKRPDASFKNAQIRRFVTKTEERIASIDYVDGLSCSELVKILLQRDRMPASLEELFNEYISTARLAPRSIQLNKNCYASISSFFGGDMDIRKIRYGKIMELEKYLRTLGNRATTIRTKMAMLSKLIVYARRCRYVPFDFRPFDGYVYPDVEVRDSWITVEQIKLLRDIPLKGTMQNVTRDFIMLSYCLGGINVVDLLNIDFNEARRTGMLKYVRQKTCHQKKINKFVEFEIPDEAWSYVDRLIQHDGYLGSPYQRKSLFHYYFSQCIKSLREQTGMPGLVYYSARKSFAQHAFNLGISTSVIDFILGHKLDRGGTSLYSYISVTPAMATNAIRKVLDNLK
ncbi:MAG: phage integrase SAM-like domain-containing protein [Duncaniella sp.]|nr:phage integrase SAM-like domain-containing protein [Duncaniella sp.]